MGDFGIAEIAALVSAAAAASGAGVSIAKASQGPTKMPTAASPPVDYTAIGRAAIPGSKADAAARGLGGSAPDFLAKFIGTQTGEPQAGLSVLEDLRRQTGSGVV